MRYLITGVSGFVGGHFLEHIASNCPEAEVMAADMTKPDFGFLPPEFASRIRFRQGSLLDMDFVDDIVVSSDPDYLVHLAAYSSVAYSWKDPVMSFMNNVNIFLNLAEAVRRTGKKTIILSVGSSEEYGIVSKKDLPLQEDMPLDPVSPYAVARVSQEQLSKVYSKGYGVPVVCTRSFNHIGPRQRENFVISSFAKQIVEIKKGIRRSIRCGNLDVIRDFIDVRDVVSAYDLLLKKGVPGEIYNICSGKGHSLSDMVRMLGEVASQKAVIEPDPSLMRPAENPLVIGDGGKLARDTGFRSQYSLRDSMRDILDYWKKKLEIG